ncbi:MAG TPA: GNAT family N-acetyltransferase [Bradyrhizobium sp.]
MSAASLEPARAAGATVRQATAADAEGLGQTLTRAFYDDPVMMHLMPDVRDRDTKLPRVFKLLFKLALPHRACFVTSGYEAATLWRPPNGWHVSIWEYLVNAPELLGIFGARALTVLNTMDRVEKLHPHTPHWYLQTIGTDPDRQGKGYGSLMRQQLAVADAAGLPCYLESSKDTNIAIYKSFGFDVTGEIKIPDGPTLWPMWRDAHRPN